MGGVIPKNVSLTAPITVGGPEVLPTGSIASPPTEPSAFTVQDLAQLLASASKDHLTERKLAQYNGDPSQRHEWFGQLKNTIDSTPLTHDVKLTHFNIIVTGKTKTVFPEFAY